MFIDTTGKVRINTFALTVGKALNEFESIPRKNKLLDSITEQQSTVMLVVRGTDTVELFVCLLAWCLKRH